MAMKAGKDTDAEGIRKSRRWQLRYSSAKQDIGGGVADAIPDDSLFQRQVPDEGDPFEAYYAKGMLLQPPFMFSSLYRIYEQSDVLQECIEAMIANVDGFGYQMQFTGDDRDLEGDREADSELEKAKNFFDRVNDEQSMMTIRKLMRQDYEVLGNEAFEVIRNNLGEPQMMFHIPFQRLRMTKVDRAPIPMDVLLPRNGKPVKVRMQKYMRRYCQIEITGTKLRWFKQYGDPRVLDATTGEFMKAGEKPKMIASEILHFKQPFGDSVYGIPRWIGAIMDILGRRSSQYVNYDLFENQGIPPMAVMVSGGVLTDDSMEDLENMVRSLRGAGKWNKILILESNLESQGLEDKGNAKIELKNLSEYRKEDQMFGNYLSNTEKVIRHRYRFPPMYVGGVETFTLATAKAAKTVGEEQIFVPERTAMDEFINNKVCSAIGITKWKYATKGPQIVGAEEISNGVQAFANTGAFTVNNAIEMANAAFGLQMSKFTEPWADYPFPLVLKLAEKDSVMLEGLEDVVSITTPAPVPAPAGLLKAPPKPEVSKSTMEAVMKSEWFTPEEKQLYKRMRMLQMVVEEKDEQEATGPV